MKTQIAFLTLSLSVASCGSNDDKGSGSNPAVGAIDSGKLAPDSGKLTPDSATKPEVHCSLPAEMVPSFDSVTASGNGFDANPLDVEVVGKMGDKAELVFQSKDAKPIVLGKHQMAGQWLDGTCDFCLFLNSKDDENNEFHIWMPVSGEIEISSVVDTFKMTGTNVRFQHVKFIGHSTMFEPASDCQSLFTSFEINTPMVVGSGK